MPSFCERRTSEKKSIALGREWALALRSSGNRTEGVAYQAIHGVSDMCDSRWLIALLLQTNPGGLDPSCRAFVKHHRSFAAPRQYVALSTSPGPVGPSFQLDHWPRKLRRDEHRRLRVLCRGRVLRRSVEPLIALKTGTISRAPDLG